MANRMFNQFQGSLEKGVVQLFAEVSFDASGVATLVRGKGFSSVFQPGAIGSFRLLLQDSYNRMLFASASVQGPAGVPTVPFVFVTSSTNVTADPPSASVNFLSTNFAGALTNVTSTTVFITVFLSNSTAI